MPELVLLLYFLATHFLNYYEGLNHLKTLLLSDEKTQWEQVRRTIRSLYPQLELICAVNKEEALNYASFEGPFGFFLIDAEIKAEDPDEVTKTLLDICGNRPSLFIGKDTIIRDRISSELFLGNEFNDSIFKPFEVDDFKMKVDQALTWAKKEEFEESLVDVNPEDYLPMKIRSFYLYNQFPYDVFMEVTSTKYMKILPANKSYSLSMLSEYAKKNVKFFYIKKDDQLEYLENESKKCLKSLTGLVPSSKESYTLLLKSINILHQYINAIGVTPSVLTLGSLITDTIFEVSSHYRLFRNVMERYPQDYEGVASKSLLCALICDSLCVGIGWNSSLTRKKLILASILQDVTLREDNLTHITMLSDPKLQSFTQKQVEDYVAHPVRAAVIASQFTSFTDVDYIVELHHELPNRKGFPNTPSHTKLTPICSVFNISQHIASELDLIKKPNNQHLVKILRAMNRDYNIGSFKEALKISRKVLSFTSDIL